MKLILILILILFCECKNKHILKSGLEGTLIPSFNILLIDGDSSLNVGKMLAGKPTIIFLFSPTCPYCRALTREIINDKKNLSNIRFYLISSLSYNKVKSYYNYFELEKYSYISIAQDYKNYFIKYFNVTALPYLAIYGQDNRLKQVVVGKISTKQIKQIALN